MKRITKTFKTLSQAEAYQNRLCNQYNLVHLIQAPFFSEAGLYVWEVE